MGRASRTKWERRRRYWPLSRLMRLNAVPRDILDYASKLFGVKLRW